MIGWVSHIFSLSESSVIIALYYQYCMKWYIYIIINNILNFLWFLPFFLTCTNTHILVVTKRLITQYHPKNVKSSKEQNATYLQSRVKGFLYLLESGSLETLPLSQNHGDDIIKLMDTGEIKVHPILLSSIWQVSMYIRCRCCSCHQDGGRNWHWSSLLGADLLWWERGQGRRGRGGEERKREKQWVNSACTFASLSPWTVLLLHIILFVEKPSFMVSEPTEEEKQLAEQAKEYGKMRQQTTQGEEEGAESEEPPPPGTLVNI